MKTLTEPEKKAEQYRKRALQLKDLDWNRAIKYIELAEIEAKKTGEPDFLLAHLYVTAGKMYASKDVLDIALQYYLKAHEIYKDRNNPDEISKLENNLAIIYSQGNNKEKALQYFYNVYRYQSAKKDSVKLVKVLNNIGTIYQKRNPDSSLYYYKKAYVLNKYLKDNNLKIYVCTNLAQTYGLKKDKNKAALYYNEAFSFMNKPSADVVKAFAYESFAEYNLKEKNYDIVIENAQKALELNKGKAFSFSGLNLNKILSQAYIKKQDFKTAVYYFQQHNIINDSIDVEQKAVNLERIRLEQDYKARTQIRELIEEQKRSELYLIGLILVVGILILIILLIKYRNRNISNQLEREILKRKEHELKQSLEAKNMVLIGKAMSEIHRTDNINEILTDLKKIKLKTAGKELQQAIDIVLKRLEKNLNTDIWKEFEISFEQVHKSFFDKLTFDYPSLSPKDRRLCALLYLDLTTKEISQITGQSFKSIENARTRLRKKFDLTNEKVNLSTYLNSFKPN
ncbi:tetratricopeptide repeat protein [Flavobacterium gelatinilyticum]|uniref:tetratricopeptide repeat protein n=1 Tax=Flavobacterium gelatinilyticum TaxID=3003260 RepID=UPI002480AD4E|nr:hypothetical protein [Flavobacterium gelatinilyticum]